MAAATGTCPMRGYPSLGDGAECPFGIYEAWRRDTPVHALEDRPNLYVVSRYADVKYVVSHPELFSSVNSRTCSGCRPRTTTGSARGAVSKPPG